MARLTFAVLALLLTSVAALGQQSSTTGGGAESPQGIGEVQVGAGTNGDVTTGASGPSTAANPALSSLPAAFEIKPPSDPFLGPGSLPIEAPARLRCDLIRAERARQRCEEKAP